MTDNAPYSIPIEPGRWRAIALAATVHAALIAFLWIGIHWQSQVPIAVEAEVWSPEVREAAPPPPPEPIPKPVVKPEPQPEPKPVIKEAPPPPKVVEPIVRNPEIALEKERKRKAQEQKERDREEQARADKERQRKADEQERKEREKKDAEKLAEKEKAAAAAKKKAETAAEAKQKEKQEAVKKAAAEKQRLADAAADDKRHNDDMKRLLGQASGNGASSSTGTAAQSQGPRAGDPGYKQKVANKIKGNINFNVPDDLAGNPSVEYEVQLLPDGSVASIHLRKSSGVSGFDEAVKRAIEKSAPYPKDKSLGSVPSSFIGIHKPKDQ